VEKEIMGVWDLFPSSIMNFARVDVWGPMIAWTF